MTVISGFSNFQPEMVLTALSPSRVVQCIEHTSPLTAHTTFGRCRPILVSFCLFVGGINESSQSL